MKPSENLSAKDLLRTSVALLMISSMASVYAGERDITQSHTQEFTHTELNSQLTNSSFGQSRNRDENTVMNHMNTINHYMQGSAATGFINRQNTANHSMSGGVIKVF